MADESNAQHSRIVSIPLHELNEDDRANGLAQKKHLSYCSFVFSHLQLVVGCTTENLLLPLRSFSDAYEGVTKKSEGMLMREQMSTDFDAVRTANVRKSTGALCFFSFN